MPYFYIDYWYVVLVIPAVIFSLIASWKVKSTYKKYGSVFSARNLTAENAARYILSANGISNVGITRIAGDLTDNYNPQTNVVSLSNTVYGSTSIAAIGVAAHECGHAVQHSVGYFPIKLRTAIVPVTNIASSLAMPLVLIGLVLGMESLAMIGCIFFGTATFFQLVTLPVEFDASRRAINALEMQGILGSDEIKGAKKVLTAAAMTYVAALAVSLAQLLRLLLIVRGNNGRRR